MTGPLIWMIATAVMTITILTVGTLASAGIIFHRSQRPAHGTGPTRPSADAPEVVHRDPETGDSALAARTNPTPRHRRHAA